MVIENMDDDSDGVPGSDMHAKKWSEYSSNGKITSSDPMTPKEELEARIAERERLAKEPSYNASEICARNALDDDKDKTRNEMLDEEEEESTSDFAWKEPKFKRLDGWYPANGRRPRFGYNH